MDAKKADELRNSKEFRAFANNAVWYMQPNEALADINFFLVHIMAKLPEAAFDYAKNRFKLTEDDFVEALRNAPPGEFIYEENWAEWNEKLGLNPPLPFPRKYPKSTLS